MTGGPVVLDPIATIGEGDVNAALVNLRTLALASSGSASLLTTLVKVGALSSASAGQSNAAVVLIEIKSLSAIAQGGSSVGVSLNKIGIVTAASAGVGAAQATLSAIRALGQIGTVGKGDANVALGGARVALGPISTAGSSSIGAQFDSPLGGSLPIGGYARRTRTVRPDWIQAKPRYNPFRASTSGASSVGVRLTLGAPDPLDDQRLLAIVLLEAAA